MIDKDTMISVPAQVLQDLLWNYELSIAATGPNSRCEELMEKQCGKLQKYLTPEDYVDPNAGFTFDDFDNVEFVDFGKRG
jgi:hypothetical protein